MQSSTATGKISLDHIYTQPDPRDYFTTLRRLEYQIPQQAQPFFRALVDEYKTVTGTPLPTVLDIGSSYGINAALMKCGATMDDLYDRYAGPDAAALDRVALLDRDRALVRSRRDPGVRFTGLDASGEALAYALAAGFLDDAVHADLEENDPTPMQRARLSRADLVVSTGCVGYVTERTLARVIEAQDGRRPWMAHFVLRMFPFDSVEDVLDSAGYTTTRYERLFPQRRFATPDERADVLDTLRAEGVDPAGRETEGWFYARLFVSRPRDAAGRAIIDLAPASSAATGGTAAIPHTKERREHD
ncbi:class I SAM-dependent methyltransferase [Actinomadura rayongensis]|uniref:Class I SAM-dependent methyltransferase n=1 Tax=Actinomadura rayongensis TaxID=1429076 RepID=A0A6I4WKA7_9ACTN|nr:class I SAM-dependent methyltransferase [Actinomadura rayongensis]MXQ67052.1 class I SAM-dependent methyltransferase [Actinomadura rayongensis]